MILKTIYRACLFIAGLNVVSANAQGDDIFDTSIIKPRIRVIIDNDFSGDPDGLFQLAHQVLSPSVEVKAIIGSHLRANDFFDNSKTQAKNAAGEASALLKVMKLSGKVPVLS